MCLDQYNMEIEHRPRTRHTNADGLSKRTNLYVIKEQNLRNNPAVKEGFNFLDQEVYDSLPTLDSVDKHGQPIEPKTMPKVEIIRNERISHPFSSESEDTGTERQEPGELRRES